MRLIASLLSRYRAAPPLKSRSGKWSKIYANLPESYILRKSQKLIEIGHPEPGCKTHIQTTQVGEFIMDRPWSSRCEEKVDLRNPGHGTFVQPIKEEDWMWFKGDRVSTYART